MDIISSTDNILDLINEGVPVDLQYFDFNRAFDTVPYLRLLIYLNWRDLASKEKLTR